MTKTSTVTEIGRVGSFAVRVYCEALGLDSIPYPFNAWSAHESSDGADRDRSEILEWLRTDPPHHLAAWIRASAFPDLSMQLYGVFPRSSTSADIDDTTRINAVRRNDEGYVAVQEASDHSGRSGDIVVYRCDATMLTDAMLHFTPDVPAGSLGDVTLDPPTGVQVRSLGSIAEMNNNDGERVRLDTYTASPTQFSAFIQVVPFRQKDWGLSAKHRRVVWNHKHGDGQYLIDRSDGGRIARSVDRKALKQAVNREVKRGLAFVRERRESLPADVYAGDA